jgi:hypothetical protein
MPHPRFDVMKERLLRAGLAPRHVRRYIAELDDHWSDLVREEMAKGTARLAAEADALSRLGDENDLAAAMLERRDLRSLIDRLPWASFIFGPLALVVASIVAVLFVEAGVLTIISHFYANPLHRPPPEWFMLSVAAWNAWPTFVAPLAIALFFVVLGARQRMPAGFTLLSVAITCALGGFQQLSFVDNGYHGELSFGSGLLPPFPHGLILQGVLSALVSASIAIGTWWLLTRQVQVTMAGLERATQSRASASE